MSHPRGGEDPYPGLATALRWGCAEGHDRRPGSRSRTDALRRLRLQINRRSCAQDTGTRTVLHPRLRRGYSANERRGHVEATDWPWSAVRWWWCAGSHAERAASPIPRGAWDREKLHAPSPASFRTVPVRPLGGHRRTLHVPHRMVLEQPCRTRRGGWGARTE